MFKVLCLLNGSHVLFVYYLVTTNDYHILDSFIHLISHCTVDIQLKGKQNA